MNLRILLSVLPLLFFGCTENGPIIPPLGPQELGDRKVLVEEFTGVRCPNCPPGSAELESLISLYGENLIMVSIHASGSFAIPLEDSKFDFRTTAGEQLRTYLGQPFGYPSAVINRKQLPGRSTLQLNQAAWASTIEEELQLDPALAINLTTAYNADNRQISATVILLPNQTIDETLHLSLMLTEDGIIDKQLTPNGKDDNYLHRHVLRTMLTRSDGNALPELERGKALERTYTINLPENWQADQCDIIAFVHQTGDSRYVWQAERTSVLD